MVPKREGRRPREEPPPDLILGVAAVTKPTRKVGFVTASRKGSRAGCSLRSVPVEKPQRRGTEFRDANRGRSGHQPSLAGRLWPDMTPTGDFRLRSRSDRGSNRSAQLP
jgi:hypothetical protein